jgi:hypothetical protein
MTFDFDPIFTLLFNTVLFLALIFTENKICPDENPSPRPRPSINLVTLQNRPCKESASTMTFDFDPIFTLLFNTETTAQ